MNPNQIPENVFLEIIEGDNTGTTFTISNKTITIGRDEGCDFVIKNEFVSSKHCQIVFREDHFTVMDLNSLNKTKINDEIHIQRNLDNGDIITLGPIKMKFNWADQDAIYKWYQ
ncbi:MAG: FHA domain-containing protein [Spirochaetes bacterium]|nr:FHA domain-containing protein [Spirochaetota bacterium]